MELELWSPFGPALGLPKVKLLWRLEWWHDWRRKQYLQTADSHFYFWHHVWMLLAECSESISHNHTAHIKKCPGSIVGKGQRPPSLLNLFIRHQHSHRHMAFSITISTQIYLLISHSSWVLSIFFFFFFTSYWSQTKFTSKRQIMTGLTLD